MEEVKNQTDTARLELKQLEEFYNEIVDFKSPLAQVPKHHEGQLIKDFKTSM